MHRGASIVAAAFVITFGLAAAGSANAATTAKSGMIVRTISYLGHQVTVPSSWPVVDLTKRPDSCVRFDRHAVYLGTPSAQQDCPAHPIGKTEAMLIQPAATTGPAGQVVDHTTAHEFTATASGVTVTVTYAHDPSMARSLVAEAVSTATSKAGAVRIQQAPALTAAPAIPATSTDYTGQAFDSCAAPSASAMSAWMGASPYRGIGVYIGGADRSCSQPNLTASWVSQQSAAGWHFMPIYVGPQAAVSEITAPASQGVAAADDAATQAAALGFGPGAPIYYDMESYSSSQSGAALSFIAAWTNELHARGYKSGEYSSMSTGIADLVGNYSSSTMPDVIDFAAWPGSGSTSTTDPGLPSGEWANHQRVHQYSGDVSQTFGGVTIKVDQDYMDVKVTSANPLAMATAQVGTGGNFDLFYLANGRVEYRTGSPNGGWLGAADVPSAPSGVTSLATVQLGSTGQFDVIYDIGGTLKYQTGNADGTWQGIADVPSAPTGVSDVTSVQLGTTGQFDLIYDVGGTVKYQTGTSTGGWLGVANLPSAPTGVSGLSTVQLGTTGQFDVVYNVAGAVKYQTGTSTGGWLGAADVPSAPTGVSDITSAQLGSNGQFDLIYDVGGTVKYQTGTSTGGWLGVANVPSAPTDVRSLATAELGSTGNFDVFYDANGTLQYQTGTSTGGWLGVANLPT